MSSSHGLELCDTPEPVPKQQLFSEITYENLDTAASEASLRGRHRHSPDSSSSASSAAAYGGWSRFSVTHGDDAVIRSAAGNSIFTGRLSFKRSLQWNPTASIDRKLRERRLSLWQYGSLPGAESSSFRTPQAPRSSQLVCFALSFLTAGIALVVLVVCLRLATNSDDPLASAKHVPELPCEQYEYCRQQQSAIAERWVNWSANPCEDFHEYVCGAWTRSHGGYSAQDEERTDSVLNTLLSRALSEMAEKPPVAANGSQYEFELANDVLFEQCMKTDSRERRSLGVARKQLAQFGLGGWPYTAPHNSLDVTFSNVLLTATRLALNLGLTALVNVRVFGPPTDRTFEVDDPALLLRKDDLSGAEVKARALVLHRQLIAESFFYFAHNSKDVYKVQEQIQLVSLILAHATRRSSERSFCTFSHETVPISELGVLELYIRRLLPEKTSISENVTVLLRNPLVARALDFVFRYLKPEHLLNYLGFRLLVHLSPFIFEIPNNIVRARMNQLTGVDKMVWLKAEVCLRLSEEALPLFYLYDLYASKSSAYWQGLDSVLNIIKRAVLTRAVVPWKFSTDDKKKLLRILMFMEYRTFLPRWLLNDTLLEAYNQRLLPNRNADVFQMYAHVWRRRTHAALSPRPLDRYVTDPDWQGSVFDTMPVYSFADNTLHIPMALFNMSLPATQDAFYMHAITATWKLAYALAPIFELSNYWDNATLASYANYEVCAASRYGPYLTPGIRDSALHLAYADEISVFWAERLVSIILATSAVNPVAGMSREHFFYIYMAMSKCRNYGVSLQPTSTVSSKQRLNIPFLHSLKFRKLWSCRSHWTCK